MGWFERLFKKGVPDPAERRRQLLSTGRITDGVILDAGPNDDGDEVVHYLYTLNGVDFESSDVLTPQQLALPAKYAPGAKVAIRYDPRNQGNSIVE